VRGPLSHSAPAWAPSPREPVWHSVSSHTGLPGLSREKEIFILRDLIRKWSWLWVLAFLALPNCALEEGGLGTGTHVSSGTAPFSSAVFCDIENASVARHCASSEEVSTGIPLTQAALALVRSQSSPIGLDYSPAATSALGCGPGVPVAITFRGAFPDGANTCLNCGAVMPSPYPNAEAVCTDLCRDLNDGGDVFCADTAHAHTSTNAHDCVAGACTNAGALRTDFVDTRRTLEPVIWVNQVDTTTSGPDNNTLTRSTETITGFNAGAASKSDQTIASGDGYVEFTATETDKARVCGLSTGPSPDLDPSLTDVGYAIRLTAAATVVLQETSGIVTPAGGALPYATGDRLRVSVTDTHDGKATITYSLIPAACSGPSCAGTTVRTVVGASYPFRVDASIKELGGSLGDVRIVRIH
jgi:hypothetical protein